MKNVTKLFGLICCVFISSCASGVRAKDSCALTRPPTDAAVTWNHGVFFFVFPRGIGESYSGCQMMWDEHGNRLFTLMFEKGVIVKYVEEKNNYASTGSVCYYKNGSLLKNGGIGCPDYESVRAGIRTLPESEEPVVPKDRDLRRKGD